MEGKEAPMTCMEWIRTTDKFDRDQVEQHRTGEWGDIPIAPLDDETESPSTEG